jgi:uncharacterized delta-60 repeat protein
MNNKKQSTLASLVIAIGLFAGTGVEAAPGDLDPTFGNGGRVIVSGSNYNGIAYFNDSAAIQSDGKIVVGYAKDYSGWKFVIARYNGDGTPDITFDGDGEVVAPFGFDPSDNNGVDIALQADGKILAAKASDYAPVRFVRYNANGSLDSSFGNDGVASVPVGAYGVALTVQSDGRILATADFFLIRLDPNGSVDPTFGGGDGILLLPTWASKSAIQGDGKIVVALAGGSLRRYNPDGTLDPGFGSDGTVLAPLNMYFATISIQPDGKILVSGSYEFGSHTDFALARYNSNGSLDTSFDDDGLVTTAFNSGGVAEVATHVVEASGRILAAGYSRKGTKSDFALARYNPNGSLDTSFSGDGLTSVDFDNSSDIAFGMALDSQSRAVLVGGSDERCAIARFLGNAPVSNTVTIAGRVSTPTGLGLRNAVVSLTDPTGSRRSVTTSSFGMYSFTDIPTGGTFTVSVSSRRYRFAPRTVTAAGNLSDVDFLGLE